MNTKTFKLTDDSELSVYIGHQYIVFTVFGNGRREGCIDWNFNSPDDMKAQMAAMVEQHEDASWSFAEERQSIGEAYCINARQESSVDQINFKKNQRKIFRDLKLWLRSQFQKPKLKPESEQMIDSAFYESSFPNTRMCNKSEIRELVMQIVAIEKGEG